MSSISNFAKYAGSFSAFVASAACWQTAAAQSPKPPAGTSRFDGDWQMTIVCREHTDAGVTAEGYTYHYPVHIAQGVLHGERLQRGKPGWMTLDGQIQADGTAMLHAKGAD